jgi:hypothetical protein
VCRVDPEILSPRANTGEHETRAEQPRELSLDSVDLEIVQDRQFALVELAPGRKEKTPEDPDPCARAEEHLKHGVTTVYRTCII